MPYDLAINLKIAQARDFRVWRDSDLPCRNIRALWGGKQTLRQPYLTSSIYEYAR
jgi:hypothetical protein